VLLMSGIFLCCGSCLWTLGVRKLWEAYVDLDWTRRDNNEQMSQLSLPVSHTIQKPSMWPLPSHSPHEMDISLQRGQVTEDHGLKENFRSLKRNGSVCIRMVAWVFSCVQVTSLAQTHLGKVWRGQT
jgi:hypothetical protein